MQKFQPFLSSPRKGDALVRSLGMELLGATNADQGGKRAGDEKGGSKENPINGILQEPKRGCPPLPK
jgi:hypothetical protein